MMARKPCKNCERLAVDNDKLGTRIAQLKARLEALRWTPISEENLPKDGDEVLIPDGMFGGYMVVAVRKVMEKWPFSAWEEEGYTHRRPINPPRDPSQEGSDAQ